MAEINVDRGIREAKISIAADDPRLRNIASWALSGNANQRELYDLEHYLRIACKIYGLDPILDASTVRDVCEERLNNPECLHD